MKQSPVGSRLPSRPIAAASLAVALAIVASAPGCGTEEDLALDPSSSLSAAEIEQVASALTFPGGNAAAYATFCEQNGVPKPPAWNANNVDQPPNTNSSKPWKHTGTFTDTYVPNLFNNGDIYYAIVGTGICVINAHSGPGGPTSPSEFDLICQSADGKACFWAGTQSPVPPPANQSKTLPGTFVDPGSNCTSCHVGENAFITHLKDGHPTNLVGKTGWKPSAWYQPIRYYSADIDNPSPETFAGYPASTSGGCLTCHTQSGPGGRLPKVSSPVLAYTGSSSSYCDVLKNVTSRPSSAGGMPAVSTNTCTAGLNCADVTDPFVRTMLTVCGVPNLAWEASSEARSPVALNGNGPLGQYAGSWEHVLFATGSNGSYVTSRIKQLDNYSTGFFHGWGEKDWTSSLNTANRLSMFTKANDASRLSLLARDGSGYIWESEGGLRNVNLTQAVGSPSGYIRHDGWNVVVFRAYNNYIYEAYWNGSAWIEQLIPGQTMTALGDPQGYNRGNSSSVVYKCGGLKICELRLINNAWQFRSINTSTVIKGTTLPMPLKRAGVAERTIYYAGLDGLYAISDNTDPAFGTTSESRIASDPAIASTPAPYNDQAGGVSVVYIADPGGTADTAVKEASKPSGGSTYTLYTRLTSPRTTQIFNGDPAAYKAGLNLNTILFRNSANALYQLQATSSSLVASNMAYAKTTLTRGWVVDTTGSVNQSQEKSWMFYYLTWLPAGKYKFDMTPSSGDPDLYVKVGSAPTTSTFDCRPYSTGLTAESCTVTLSSPGVIHAMVRGYAPSTSSYSLVGYHTE